MCNVRRNHVKHPSVRYCKRSATPGVVRHLTPAEIEGDIPVAGTCYERSYYGPARVASRKRVFMNCRLGFATEENCAYLAQYMEARYTIDRQQKTVQFYVERGITPAMVQRCESFGMSEYKDEDGTP